LVWLIVDSFNGFFMESGINLPLSQLYKIFIIAILIYGLLKTPRTGVIVGVTFVYIAVLFLNISLNSPLSSFGEKVNHLFRFVIAVFIYFYVRRFIESDTVWAYSYIRKILVVSTWVVVVNILSGLLGLGYTAYQEGIGFRGFFYAGNELSGVVMVLFPFMLFLVCRKYALVSKRYIGMAFLLLFTSALIGTKTALAVILLTIMILPYLVNSGKNMTSLLLFLAVFAVILGYAAYALLDYYGMIDRWDFFLNKGGVEGLILSGRDGFWEERSLPFFQGNAMVHLFGLGDVLTVEMDPFDAILNYGYVGFAFCYLFYIYLLIESFIRRKHSLIAKFVLFVDVMILCASTIAGHIMFSGMASWLIALLNTLVFVPDRLFEAETASK